MKKFMMILKYDQALQEALVPDEKCFAVVGAYNEALSKAGAFLGAEGLQPSSKGVRIRNVGGQLTVVDGPFAEAKEIIAGFWLIQAESLAEAVAWAERCPFEGGCLPASPNCAGTIEIRPLMSDCGSKPDGAPPAAAPAAPPAAEGRRYMMMFKADRNTEAGLPPDPAVMQKMGELMGEAFAAGTFVDGGGLEPSSKGARVYFSGGKRRVVDGPFAEAKELVCGYAVFRFKSKEEAVAWAKRGVLVHGDGESEVRLMYDVADLGPSFSPELQEAEGRLRAEGAARR